MARGALAEEPGQADTFTLALAWVKPVAALQAWFDQAQPGERFEYARGIDLPRDEAGVLLVTGWVSEGAVRPFQRRVDGNRACTIWMVERMRGDSAKLRRSVKPDLTQLQMASLLRELAAAAQKGAPCPTRKELALAVTGQSLRKAKGRISWLMKRLEAEGKIAVEPAPVGAQHGPTVTILTGRQAGKSTRSSSEAVAQCKTQGVTSP